MISNEGWKVFLFLFEESYQSVDVFVDTMIDLVPDQLLTELYLRLQIHVLIQFRFQFHLLNQLLHGVSNLNIQMLKSVLPVLLLEQLKR